MNFGATAEDAAHYVNRAAEMYSRLALAIEQGDLRIAPGLPTFDALAGQLAGVRYSLGSDGRRRVRKRARDGDAGGGRGVSPDLADSLALAWAAYEDGARSPGIY